MINENDTKIDTEESSSYPEFPLDPELIYEQTVITEIRAPTADKGGLYLGSWKSASTDQYFHQYSIYAVINATMNDLHCRGMGLEYLFLGVQDSCFEDLSLHFENCVSFIEENRTKRKGVLVHCQAGISRSATLIIAYLMKNENKDLTTAYKDVQRKRTCIQPNPGFIKQLFKWEKEVLRSV